MSLSVGTRVGAGVEIPIAVGPVAQASFSSADLAAMSLGSVEAAPSLQARRSAAVQRFVMSQGLKCRGDIDELVEKEADRMVRWGLFSSKEEAEKAICNGYAAFIQKSGKTKYAQMIIHVIKKRVPGFIKAVGAERIKEKQKAYNEICLELDRADKSIPAFPQAMQTFLNIHKRLKRLGVDATVRDWEKSIVRGNFKHLDRQEWQLLKRLVKEADAAGQILEKAREIRDLQRRLDEISDYVGDGVFEKNVQDELDTFADFLEETLEKAEARVQEERDGIRALKDEAEITSHKISIAYGAFAPLDNLFQEKLADLQTKISTFDYMISYLVGPEGLTYNGLYQEEVHAFIAIHKQREYALNEFVRLSHKHVQLLAEIEKKEELFRPTLIKSKYDLRYETDRTLRR